MIFDDYSRSYTEKEIDEILIGLEDWAGLLIQRRIRAEMRPHDVDAQINYADALILNKEFNEAIRFITPIYHENYKKKIGVLQIIEALIGLGKTEDDFKWIKKPVVVRPDNKTLDFCINYLKKKKDFHSVFLMYENIWDYADYITIDGCEFIDFLLKFGNIFEFQGNRNTIELHVKIKSKLIVEKWLIRNSN